MKKSLLMAALMATSVAVFAADTTVNRVGFGSGTPGKTFGNAGVENAKPVNSDQSVLHAPQYMPNYPTAAPIWPRVVEVPCTKVGANLQCEGYQWTPAMGRGEYLFVTPVVKTATAPVIVEKVVPMPVIVERKVFVEVERKVLVEVPVKKKPE